MYSTYLITEYEYYNDNLDYDKVRLFYDKSDSALSIHETDELINPYETIGENVFERIDVFDDFSTIYVRNDETETDYEVEIRNLDEE